MSAALLYGLYFLLSLGGLFLYVGFAKRKGILDRPTDRGSHTVPKPRGGGVIFSAALLIFAALTPSVRGFVALSLVIAVMGYLDDLLSLSAKARLAVQIAAAALLVWPYGPAGEAVWPMVFSVMVIVYSTNTFNFIDGIDGILGAMTVAGLLWIVGLANSLLPFHFLTPLLLLLLPVVGAFLCLNWSPSKVFMGDVGSAFLGFVVSGAAVIYSFENPVFLPAFLVLFAPLLGDCLATLGVRFITRQNIFQAHRLHAYQKLSRRWGSHPPVSLLYGFYILVVCGPVATLAVLGRLNWAVAFASAFLPVLILAWRMKAGVAEPSTATSS